MNVVSQTRFAFHALQLRIAVVARDKEHSGSELVIAGMQGLYQGGLNYMRYSVSNTAEYGDYSRGPRVVTEETRAEMKRILHEIQSGQFAREWILENRAGAPAFKAMRRRDRSLQLEEVGLRLRSLMSWIDAKEV